MVIESLKPLRVRLRDRTIDLRPGQPLELNDDEAALLLAKKSDKVWPVLRPGDVVEWRSPALPKQQGEVLVVHPDKTFSVYHPLTETLCRLPSGWVIKVIRPPINTQGSATQLHGGCNDQ
ncbi:MAG: hypothetical protein IPK92_03730 [Nitrospira sp.]|jgi:hypothetical protein|nr:hypothetical protein [Nitrospira sp.]MBL8054350.1 hypothetical protein [Nitrospira sp.]